MKVSEHFAEVKRQNAEALAAAEQRARETGKEPFDLARLEQLLNRGSQAAREEGHRVAYYVFREELRTLAEYAQQLLDNEPWEDAR
jgi:hypothetical protein